MLCVSALVIQACGPSPQPVSPGNSAAYTTSLGNQRRALFENENIPATPRVEWDINAGSGMRGMLVLLDSAVLTATTNRQMLAFDLQSGRRHWDQRFGSGVHATVLYDDRTIYIATTEMDGDIYALDVVRGKRLWRNRAGSVRFTPLLENGVIYYGTDHGVVAAMRTAKDGQIWRARLPAGIAGSVVDGGANIIVFTNADSVYALRKSDGGVVARASIGGTPAATAARHANTLIVPTHEGRVLGIDATTLRTLWQVDVGSPVLTSPAVRSDGSTYVAGRGGALYRIRDGQGEKLADLEHSIAGALTLTREHLLLGSYDGTLLAVQLDGSIAWKHKFDDSIVAPVAVRDRAIYVPLLRGRIVKLR